MKIYIGNQSEVFLREKRELVDFLYPYLKVARSGDPKSMTSHGDYTLNYELTDSVRQADFCLLPSPWNYYYEKNRKKGALDFIYECKQSGKEVISFTNGDFGVTPLDNDVVVFRQSGYQSRRLPKQHAMPAFVNDPVERFFSGDFKVREKGKKPVVGFCGQGTSSPGRYAGVFLMTLWRNFRYNIKMSPYEPQVLYPSTLRRNRALTRLERSNLVNTNFIVRRKYRGGALSEEEREATTIEFYNNIKDSDYVLSIRGGGNFSVRIYETLAMGRIPLFVNTDCVLPFDHLINWKSHVVWVEETDISRIDQILADFHASIHPDDFVQMQINNRALWQKYLTFNGFHKNMEAMIKRDESGGNHERDTDKK